VTGADLRRDLILASALPYRADASGRRTATNGLVLRAAMRRAGVWTPAARAACYGDEGSADAELSLWYATLIDLTRPADGGPQWLEGFGNLEAPASAAFTGCLLTDAGRARAERIVADHPEWREEPREDS
jgi:hypothetical protein